MQVFEHKLPPQSIDAENSILGAVLSWGECISRIIDELRAEHFYVAYNGLIYQACIDLHIQEQSIDLISVCMLLDERKQLEKCGGKVALLNLVDTAISDVNIDQYAELVIDKWKRRKLIEAVRQIEAEAFHTMTSFTEIQKKAEGLIFSLGESSTQKGLVHISELALQEYTRIEQVVETGQTPGIECGFYDLDEMTKGYQPHQLIIVAGRPAMGKSSFVAKQLTHISKTLPCALFSLEMSGGQIAQRLMSDASGIETGRMVAGQVAPNDWDTLGYSMADISKLNLWVDESMQISTSHVLSQCRRLKSEHGKIGLVAVDYLHLMLDGDDDNKELGKLTRQFKKMARVLDCPVMLCSQLSRAVESRHDKRPIMSDLRQSGAIEQDADIVMFLYRDEYYNEDSVDRGIAEVLIRKHRGGPVGTVKLLFKPETASFMNVTSG